MSFTALFLFFFGAIGVFNGLLVSLYFLFKKEGDRKSLLFGFFLFFISERAFRGLIYFFASQLPSLYSKFDPISFMFIGPFLFMYITSNLESSSIFSKYWKPHFIFWLVVAITVYYLFPFLEDPQFWKKYVLTSINFQWLFYMICSIVALTNEKAQSSGKVSLSKPISRWLQLLLLSVFWLVVDFLLLAQRDFWFRTNCVYNNFLLIFHLLPSQQEN